MSNFMRFVFLLSLVAGGVLTDRSRHYEDQPQQDGKSLFFLGGLFRKFRSRWQNQPPPPSPYGSQPVYAGYYGCGFYNCRPPPQPVQVLQAVQPIQQIQPVQPVPTIVQTPIVVQQAQVFQPSTYAQAASQQNPDPVYPVQAPPQPPPYQYPALPAYGNPQPAYGSPQPAYGNLQPYQPYPMYPTAYASAIPGQIHQNTACGYPGYLCGRRS